jgi:4-amino-4-deoxy-L-arabinose transferase-like glycosyltransferase
MPEITKTGDKDERSLPNWMWVCLTVLAVFTYFFGLTIPLLGPDEPRYAQVAREMWQAGDWITPTLGGHNWFEKPALLYWLEIASFNLFGVSEFAARLGPALFGLGTVVALWILGRKLATEHTEVTEKSKAVSSVLSVSSVAGSFANWLALIAASTLGIIVFSRGASFDITVTFPMTAALVSFFIFDHPQHKNPVVIPTSRDSDFRRRAILPLILFYFFIGVALLAKGLIGIVFPYAIVAFYYILSRRMPSSKFIVSVVWGTLLAIAIAGVWYVPMYLRHGWEFVDEFFLQHHFQRFTSNKYQHPQPFYFFFWVLPLMTLPWLPFFFAAIWNLIKGMFHRRDAETQRKSQTGSILSSEKSRPLALSPSRPLILFSLSWLAVPLVFFSLSGSKLPGYILPAVPPAIIITAVFIIQLVSKPNWRYCVPMIAIATFGATIILLTTVVPKFADNDSVKSLISAGDERGFAARKVLTMHTISHNAEFYAAGRMLRDENGKQKKLYSPKEVFDVIINDGGKPVLVLVPLEYRYQLANAAQLKSEMLKDNGELAIVAVSAK